MALHRVPPRPPWFGTAPFGTCRWCNQPILNPDGSPALRRHWHKACVENYNCVFYFNRSLGNVRRVALSDDGYRCACCGEAVDAVEVDHVIPLAEALPHSDDPLWQWRPGNLQALCPACHAVKTAAQAQRWATWRAAYRGKQREES